MIIAIDWDGTITEDPGDEYPKIGKLLPDAKEIINKLYDEGHHIIIWTVRYGYALEDMIKFILKEGIKIHGVNNNLLSNQVVRPVSPKILFDVVIDDRNILGIPPWKEIYEIIKGLEKKIPHKITYLRGKENE